MEYNFLDILFLPVIFFIGITASVNDIKFGKIKNKWILFGFIYAITVYMILILWNDISMPFSFISERVWGDDLIYDVSFSTDFLWKLGLNSFLSILFGFFLWRANMVAAGDVKLFFVFSLLLPTKYYWKSYLPIFPSFALLVNIFVIILIFIFFRSLYYLFLEIKNSGCKRTLKNLFFSGKNAVDVKGLIGFASIFLLFFWLRYFLKSYFEIDMGQYLYLFFILIIISGKRIMKILLRNNNLLLFIIIFLNLLINITGFFIDHNIALQNIIGAMKMMFIFMIFMGLLAKFINYYLNRTGVKKINIENLRPRMMINSMDMKKINEDNDFVEKYGRILSGGIKRKQVRPIIIWAKEHSLKRIEIYKKFPLAPWIFAGVISIIIFKESFVNIFLDFIK